MCLAFKFLHKLAQHLFHKLMDWLNRMMFALFIAPLIDEIGRELKSLAATALLQFVVDFLRVVQRALPPPNNQPIQN